MLDPKAAVQIKKAMNEAVRNSFIAGGNMMVIKGGEEIFYHEDGFADLEDRLPIRRDSIFRLYSMSKPVTAAAVMILVERGELDLYEPVSKFLSGFKNQTVDEDGSLVQVNREMTIKDLLAMTSGLVYGGEGGAGRATDALFKEIDSRLLGETPIGTLEAMNKLGEGALAFQPGSSWQYGISADVLGAVVEVVSGMRFGDFLHKELFKPLEMSDTAFWVPAGKRIRLVKAYADNGQGALEVYTGNNLGIINKMDRDPAFESGGAGLASTLDDYARFTQMLMNNGSLDGVQLLRPKTVKYLTSTTLNQVQQNRFEQWYTLSGHSYGNLMRVMTDSGKAGDLGNDGEYGWDGWLGAYFCNCPNEGITILIMIQKKDAGTTALHRKLRNIVLSSLG